MRSYRRSVRGRRTRPDFSRVGRERDVSTSRHRAPQSVPRADGTPIDRYSRPPAPSGGPAGFFIRRYRRAGAFSAPAPPGPP